MLLLAWGDWDVGCCCIEHHAATGPCGERALRWNVNLTWDSHCIAHFGIFGGAICACCTKALAPSSINAINAVFLFAQDFIWTSLRLRQCFLVRLRWIAHSGAAPHVKQLCYRSSNRESDCARTGLVAARPLHARMTARGAACIGGKGLQYPGIRLRGHVERQSSRCPIDAPGGRPAHSL